MTNTIKKPRQRVSKAKEQMISYEIIYEPDVLDTDGQWASAETLERACTNFNTNLKAGIVKANLFHVADTDLIEVVDTWINKELDVTVTTSNQPIKAGSWIAKMQYKDVDLWELRKQGVITGVSICANGEVDKETGEITSITFDNPIEVEETE